MEEWIEDVDFTRGDQTVNVRFFRMKLLVDQDKTWPPENREHEWLLVDDAVKMASYTETRQLLEKASKQMEEIARKQEKPVSA